MRSQHTSVQSEQFEHKTACNLIEGSHTIRTDFVEVIEEVADRSHLEVDWGAAGCNGCFHTDADASIFWVAQGEGSDKEMLKYHSNVDHYSTEEFAEFIVEVAEDLGVDVSWNGSSSQAIVLGADDFYVNIEPGTFVEQKRRGTTRRGVVIHPDVFNSQMNFEVREDTDSYKIGDKVAEFADRETAEEFAGEEYVVRSIMKYGERDGDNMVQFEGTGKIEKVSTSDLDY